MNCKEPGCAGNAVASRMLCIIDVLKQTSALVYHNNYSSSYNNLTTTKTRMIILIFLFDVSSHPKI